MVPADLRRRRLVTAACMAAMFVAAVEGTIVATAAPTIVAQLGDFRLFSWVFAAYFLMQAVTTPIYGRLADIYGRRRAFLAGCGLFLVGSVACGFAGGMMQLVLFRAIQGVGAGAIQPIATTIIGDIYTPAERARVQGWLSSVWGIAALVGPVLGAFIVEHAHWGLVFWINVPIGLAAMVMIVRLFDEKPPARQHRLDYVGSGLLMLGTTTALLALMELDYLDRAMVAGLAVAGIIMFAVFAVHQRRVEDPILPFGLWRNPIIVLSGSGGLVIGALFMCVVVFLPTYVQGVMGRTAVVAGAVLTAQSVAWTLGSAVSGRLMVRTSYRTTGSIGGLCLIAGSLMLAVLDPRLGPTWAAIGACAIGVGMGFCSTTFVVSTQTNVGWSTRGAATSSILFMRMIGQSLGAALGGAILNLNIARHAPDLGGKVDKLLTPGLREQLSGADIVAFSDAIGAAVLQIYLFAGTLGVAALMLALALPRGLSPTTSASA
jgi:EmrB/QacA subfamily drug resistance transporter